MLNWGILATFMKHAKLRKLSSKSALTLHMDSKGANLLPHRQMNTTSPCMVLPNDTHGDGKTTVTVMNSDMEEILMINSYSELGFRLNTKLFVVGPAVLFPKLVLQWNVGNSPNTITEESLSLFKALDPPVDILIVGLGNANTRPNPKIVKYCLANKINVEFLPTYQACSTFNFLNAEQRYVAAALIPPTIITFKTAGILAMERRKLLEGTSMGLEETESLIKR